MKTVIISLFFIFNLNLKPAINEVNTAGIVNYRVQNAYSHNAHKITSGSVKKAFSDLSIPKNALKSTLVLGLIYKDLPEFFDSLINQEKQPNPNQEETKKLKEENAVKQYSLERSETLRYYLIIILAAMCIVAVFIYVAYKKNQRFALELSHTNSIVNQQRNEIASSLDIEKDLNNKLNEANSSLERFFSIIAHDLRGPYNIMLGYADILVDNFDNLKREEIKKYVENLHKAAHKNYQLTQNLLSWAILQKGGITVNKEKLNAKQLVEDSINIYAELATQKNIALINLCPEDLVGNLDKNITICILSNLINNAIKYTPQNGKVIVSAKKMSSWIVFKVDDNGVGMTKKIQNNLFELTKMSSKEGTANEPGSGLGLILCKELAVTHRGDIRVKSILGKGTTVLALL